MAFYLNRLPDGKPLPKKGKWDFFLRKIPESTYLGTKPPKDFFAFIVNGKSELVAIAENDEFDAACWVDLPQQLEICSQPSDRVIHWMRIPDAHKMVSDEYDT